MLDRYKQGFQEEAREILVELEATLLALDQSRGDMELVGQAFRGLHTIKGSGSMFGFVKLAAFTHKLENAFDEVRNDRLEVSSELVELTLAALDQMKAMLLEADGQGTVDEATCAPILEKLLALMGTKDGDASASAVVHGMDVPQMIVDLDADTSLLRWKILFRPGAELIRSGSDPLLLLRDLRGLGRLEVTAKTESVPPLVEIDPEHCYLHWELELTGNVTEEEIRDVFIFCDDLCDLSVERVLEPVAEEAAKIEIVMAPVEAAPVERRAVGRRAEERSDGTMSIRVPTPKLDQFVDLVGELVTVQARLAQIASRCEDADITAVSEEVERLTSALRENSMSIRMLPIRGTFERFRRLVHDLARDLHKEVELTIEGADTELDKTVIDQLNDPLMHLIRNSMDHGIESGEQRVTKGKERVAKLHLSARHSGASVLIGVSDDGGGIHAEAVRARAIERGLISPEAQLTEQEIFSLILTPGFSTAREVTDVSGRGVGMDVVRQRVEALRGTIQIESVPGQGTSVTLRLPLTLAIIDGLLVRVDESYFVLPLANSLECVELTRQDIVEANEKHIANVRGEIIPYIRLREYFDIHTERPEREQIMIAETDDGRCGFVVDEVLGDHQTVIKNLGQFYRHVQFISGATILGDGTLALILDPNRIVQDANRSVATTASTRGPLPPYGIEYVPPMLSAN